MIDCLRNVQSGQVKQREANSINTPLCGGEDPVIGTMMLGGLTSAQSTENRFMRSEQPARDKLPKGLRSGLGHDCGENLQKRHER
jgi:hypothetical protein